MTFPKIKYFFLFLKESLCLFNLSVPLSLILRSIPKDNITLPLLFKVNIS